MPLDHLTAVPRASLHTTILDELTTKVHPEEIIGLFLCGVGNVPNLMACRRKLSSLAALVLNVRQVSNR
jgi:hypothetical protein